MKEIILYIVPEIAPVAGLLAGIEKGAPAESPKGLSYRRYYPDMESLMAGGKAEILILPEAHFSVPFQTYLEERLKHSRSLFLNFHPGCRNIEALENDLQRMAIQKIQLPVREEPLEPNGNPGYKLLEECIRYHQKNLEAYFKTLKLYQKKFRFDYLLESAFCAAHLCCSGRELKAFLKKNTPESLIELKTREFLEISEIREFIEKSIVGNNQLSENQLIELHELLFTPR